MVATIKALSTGYTGDYHMSPQSSDYYTGKAEDRGEFYGKAATALGLPKKVTREIFEQILLGNNPKTGESLVPKRAKDRCPGIDLTFSVPNDVSAAWVVADKKGKAAIERSIKRSVKETLDFVEECLNLARFGRGGHIKDKAGLVAALFMHFCNRNGDPQLHVHAVIANVVQDKSGGWRHMNTGEIFTWTRTLGPLFRAALANHLKADLSIECVQATGENGKRQSWFSLKGIPKALLEKWSSRRREIEEFTKSDEALGAPSSKARAKANLETRKSKSRLPHIDVLHEGWQKDAAEHRFTFESIVKSNLQIPGIAKGLLYRNALKDTIMELTKDVAHFSFREVLCGVAERVQALGFTPIELSEKVRESISRSRSLVHLQDKNGEHRYTTKKMWQLEGRLLRSVEALQNRGGAKVTERKTAKAIAAKPTIDQEQAEAVRRLTSQNTSIRLMHGVAGSGKSFALDVVRDAFERSGYRVVGGAVSGIAKENLAQGANIESRTVASYLCQFKRESDPILKLQGQTNSPNTPKLDRKTVVILDEAGMLDSESMSRILKAVVKAKATIVLVGDDKQLQPIGPGGPFSFLKERIDCVSLTKNRRQVFEADRTNLDDIRSGNAIKALTDYAERKLLSVLPSRIQAANAVVKEMISSGGAATPMEHSVFTETRKEASYINRKIQQARLDNGYLDPASAIKVHGMKFFGGDRVLFAKADKLKGIENGYKATILSTNTFTRTMRVELDTPKRGLSSIVQVSFDKMSPADIQLGYASTTHKGQGSTSLNSYVLLGGGMTNLNMAYTQLSRAKHKTKIFLDEDCAGPSLKNIARRISKEQTKTLAHSLKRIQEPQLEL